MVCATVLGGTSHSQKGNDAATLNAEVEDCSRLGKYAEAIETAERLLVTRQKTWGQSTPKSGSRSTTWRGCIESRAATQRPSPCTNAASPFVRRRWVLNTSRGHVLNNLAVLYQAQGRYAEAEPLFKRTSP